MSYNSTGLDPAKIDWIRNLSDTCKIDFLQLQEHFKTTKTLDSHFRKEFPRFDSFVTPAFREAFQDSGRAKGGLAQLVDKKRKIKKEKLTSNSWRIQAQLLHINSYKLIWLNCYFPTDPQTLQYDDSELISVLDEMEKILDNNEFDDCLIGGDLNFDNSRGSGFTKTVRDFMSRVGICSIWEKFPIDFTHLHTDLKSVSVLDHFLVNHKLLDHIEDAGPVHLGDNLSRHSPIMMKLKLPAITARAPQPPALRPRRPAWYKATEEQKSGYTAVLNERLEDITFPTLSMECKDVHCKCDIHTKDRDKLVIDILCSVIETSYTSIPLTGIPRSSKGHGQPLPGWNEFVAPLKTDSLFWHSVWISAGRPSTGSLHQVMSHARNKYHLAVRQAKKVAAESKARELAAAAEAGDIALVKEMKNSLNTKDTLQSVPDCLEGKVTHDDILDKFRECYEGLYNSAGTEAAMVTIKESLKCLIKSSDQDEVSKVTGEVVKEACGKMKRGKMDVTGFFSSDVFLNAPDSLFSLLASIFRSYLTHGSLTPQILTCAFLPLYKGGLKNPERFDSYRAIAGASQILKLFEYVILKVWGHDLDIDSMQFGFRAGFSTTQCSWVVKEVATYFMRRGTAVNACLLDCSKAFDKCRFDKLFVKLLQRGFPPIVVRVLVFAYEEQTACVKLAGKQSKSFKITNGTRQGSVLSPILFSIYLDDLLKDLRKQGLGCHIGGLWYGALGYADDLILLAPNREVLQKMIQVCEIYAAEHNLVFSTDPIPAKSKTKCLLFCGKSPRPKYPDPLKLNGKDLPWVETAEHLGHTLHQDTTMDKDCLRARARYITKSLEVRNQLGFADPKIILRALQIFSEDAYGCMLWDLGSDMAESFFKCWNTNVKLVYGVPRSTFTYLVEGHFANMFTSFRNQVYSRFVGFYKNLLVSPSKEVRFLASLVADDPRSISCKNIRLIETKTKLMSPFRYSQERIKASLPVHLVPENEKWRLGLIDNLQKVKAEKHSRRENTSNIEAMIEGLCST